MSPRPRAGHAVVIGASMAGVLAARVLSDFFDRVTVLERDPVSDTIQTRKGIPQSHHLHVLLPAGANILERLFPGILDELRRDGSVLGNLGKDLRWFQYGVWKASCDTPLTFYCQTRAFLDSHVRQRLAQFPNVGVRGGCDVVELTGHQAGGSLRGVRFRHERRPVEEMTADLVVDASGRGSRTAAWLQQLGFVAPKETTVRIEIVYSSRMFQPPPDFHPEWKLLFVSPTPPTRKKGGIIYPVEGNRWLVTLSGRFKDFPPTDDEGFLAYARELEQPALHEVLLRATPLTPVVTYRFRANLRRHYEHLSRVPERLIVMGDAMCCFNPVYGQGMAACALAAEVLGACLRESAGGLNGLSKLYFRRAGKFLDVPWQLATGNDLLFPETEGKRPRGHNARAWYLTRVQELCGTHSHVVARLYEVLSLMKNTSALLRPDILYPVLRSTVRAKRSATQ